MDHNKWVMGQVGCLKGFTSVQKKSELRGWQWKERVPPFCSQDWVSKTSAEAEARHCSLHCHPGTRRGHGKNACLHWGVHGTHEPGVRRQVHCAGKGLTPPTPVLLHTHLNPEVCPRSKKEASLGLAHHQNCYFVDRRERRHTWVNRMWLRAI